MLFATTTQAKVISTSFLTLASDLISEVHAIYEDFYELDGLLAIGHLLCNIQLFGDFFVVKYELYHYNDPLDYSLYHYGYVLSFLGLVGAL